MSEDIKHRGGYGIDQKNIRGSNGIKHRLSEFVNDYFEIVMVVPALIALLIVFVYPLINLFWLSFQKVSLSVGGYTSKFVFLDNYIAIFSDSSFWTYLLNTLAYSVGSLILSVSIGLILALAINHVKNSKIRTTYSTLILLSWASPIAVSALMWRWILNQNLGVLNMILTDLGGSSVGWLVDPTIALISVISIDAWIRIPFAMLIFLAGLQSIPPYMYDAVKIDGATTFQAFRNLTLPYLRPSFAIVILINWMFSFRAFGVVWTLTEGGPGDATEVLSTDIYRKGIISFNRGYASAASVVLVIITLVFATVVLTQVMTDVEDQ